MNKSGAIFSPDRVYRYSLWRTWGDPAQFATFICLNPSTADETKDDPTVRRCIGFAHTWGCGGVYVLNIFAYRSTDPSKLSAVEDPVGPDNDYYIQGITDQAKLNVAAWGSCGALDNRGMKVLAMIPGLYCLGLTKASQPVHPLYIKRDTPIMLVRDALEIRANEGTI